MDKKYTSLENQIRNVVRGNTGAAQDNRSLESKIRSVVLKEEVVLTEAPDDAAPPGENHLSVHELFGYLREYNEDHDRSTDPDDPDEESAKESRSDINSTEKMIKKIHGQDTLDHVRNAIESERHIRLGTNPGVNNHQAVKDHLDAAVRASRHFSEALGTGGNEGGEFKGTPPAFFKPFHAEPKVGDTHPPSEGAAAASRNRAKIASSETMKKEGYIITPSGRKPLINEAELEEGSEKFAKIMARTAAKRGEPITTDTTELEKKHAELLQAHQDALAHAEQTRKDYEDLLTKYGSVQEDSLEEKSLSIPSIPNIKIPPALANLFRGGSKSPGKPSPKAPPPAKGKPANKPSGSGAGVGSGISKLGAAAGIVSAAADLLGGGGAAAGTKTSGSGDEAGAGGDISNLTVNRHYTKGRVYHGPEIHYNEYEPDGDYIGEDSAEQTDAERSAIENVARPNSKNKLTKQAELRNKIIEDTQRRKGVIKGILRAKEENKNGKDGANSGVETKPELKRVDVNEITASELATGTRKVAGKVGRAITGPVGTVALTALDAKNAYDAGEDPERIALRTGLGAAGGIAGGLGGGVLGSAVAPGPGTFAGGLAGSIGGSELGDYVGSKLYDTGIYGKGKAFAKGAVDTVSGAADAVSDAADAVSDTASSAYNKLKGAFSSPTPAPTPKPTPTTNVGKVGGAAAGRAITQSSKPGSVGGTTAGKAITKAAPKPAPKPALKLPGPGTPGYRTDAQMAQAEADRARLLNANPNSVGAQSAGNRSVEAATKSLNTNTPAVAPQTSPGINSTNTETPRTMGSSWNNSYKNKYSMGPGPSQFPSK